MDIKELESFRLADAVKFHDELNPKLWIGDDLDPVVYDKLMAMAEDFMSELGIGKLKVEDITISGSNAAYSYTPHSDIDLHILVDIEKLPNDEVYRELFNAKKNEYNKTHDLTIRGIPVELYVQDSRQPHASLGEYSLLKRDWIKFPVKRKANFDQDRTRAKYEKLGELIELALKNRDLEDVERVLDIVKRYRKAGLQSTGEFGPENLAFKAIRKHGLFQALWDMKQKLHSERLSLKNSVLEQLDKLTMSVEDLAKKHDVSIQHIIKQLDMGVGVEQEHTSDPQVAKEIALDHLGEDPNYYTKLKKAALESASGYIPSKKQANDPRFKTALTVDIKPDSIMKNAKAFGFKTSRAGIPPQAKTNGKI
jgi:hypothetical protein